MDASKRRRYIAIVGSYVTVLLLGITVGLQLDRLFSANEDITVRVSIRYTDADVQAMPELIIQSGTSVLSLMKFIENRYGVPIEFRSFDDATVIEAIHGVHSSEVSPWMYSVNNSPKVRELGNISLKDSHTEIVWSR